MATTHGLLSGRTVLITGVITESSIAFHVARAAQEHGARVVLTGYGRLSLVRRLATRLPQTPPVVELDVTDEAQTASLSERLREHTDHLDGVLHSVAFAPAGALGGAFLSTTWAEAGSALHVSAFSLQSLAVAVRPLLRPGASIVGLDFDARQAWSAYDWMGVSKAALESCSRYLACYLGPDRVRVNLVAAGPLETLAARSIVTRDTGTDTGDGAGPDQQPDQPSWSRRAPLGWDTRDAGPVARACVVLLSDWLDATTGEIVHVDGGAHAAGDVVVDRG